MCSRWVSRIAYQLTSSSIGVGHAFGIIRSGFWIGCIVVVSHADAVHVQAVVSLNAQFLGNTRCKLVFKIGEPVIETGGEIGDDPVESTTQIRKNALSWS